MLPDNMENVNHYNQWGIVLVSVAFAAWLIFKFLKPNRKIEWRNTGILGAFVIALYTEMYGFPLTIYILSSVFGINIPLVHIKGHLWSSLFGWGATGAIVEMLIGYSIMLIGGFLIIAGWKKIYQAKNELAIEGIYGYIRHPQYTGIILITFGMLVHWPTLITLLMWPILVMAYYYLAKKEEREMEMKFAEIYQEYKSRTSMFFPSFKILSLNKGRGLEINLTPKGDEKI